MYNIKPMVEGNVMHLLTTITIAIAITSTNAKIPSDLRSFMDIHVNPCDDFYQYSCGGWINSNKPFGTQLDLSYSTMNNNNALIFEKIRNQHHPHLDELWESCLNDEWITKLGNKPLQADLKLVANARTREEVLLLAGKFYRTGTNSFLKISVQGDLEGTMMNTMIVIPADMTLPSTSMYSEDMPETLAKPYHEYIKKLIKMSNFFFSPNDIDEIIDIDSEIGTAKAEAAVKYHSMSIEHAIDRWPITFGAFSEGLGLLEKANVKEDFKIYFQDVGYFDSVEKIIKSYPVRVLKLYIAFLMVHSRASWLGNDFYRLWFNFSHQMAGTPKHLPHRSTICIENLIKYVPDLIGKYYYKTAFDTKREKIALEMIKMIKEAMGESISRSSWLNNETKEQARIKLSKIIPLVGQTTVPKSYPSMFTRDDYPANMYNILSHSFDREMKKIGQDVNRMEWRGSAAARSATYYRSRNTVEIPAAELQPPLFNGPKVHPARNFGAIGTIMGHELTHAFDGNGRHFDGDGNLREWWIDSPPNTYKNRIKCFAEQYSTFKVNGAHGVLGNVNGTFTLNENIADNGGFSIAWDAYRKSMTRDKSTYDVDEDKIFFISFGQTWCMKIRDSAMRHKLVKDVHSPPQWRVNGVLMNNNRFAETFNCKVGSPMNPTKKCQLW